MARTRRADRVAGKDVLASKRDTFVMAITAQRGNGEARLQARRLKAVIGEREN